MIGRERERENERDVGDGGRQRGIRTFVLRMNVMTTRIPKQAQDFFCK